jgi:hypothetical protein
MILPKVRDPRFVTIRRGGTLTDPDNRLTVLASDGARPGTLVSPEILWQIVAFRIDVPRLGG